MLQWPFIARIARRSGRCERTRHGQAVAITEDTVPGNILTRANGRMAKPQEPARGDLPASDIVDAIYQGPAGAYQLLWHTAAT